MPNDGETPPGELWEDYLEAARAGLGVIPRGDEALSSARSPESASGWAWAVNTRAARVWPGHPDHERGSDPVVELHRAAVSDDAGEHTAAAFAFVLGAYWVAGGTLEHVPELSALLTDCVDDPSVLPTNHADLRGEDVLRLTVGLIAKQEFLVEEFFTVTDLLDDSVLARSLVSATDYLRASNQLR